MELFRISRKKFLQYLRVVLKILYLVFLAFFSATADAIYTTLGADIPTVLDYSGKSKLKKGGGRVMV